MPEDSRSLTAPGVVCEADFHEPLKVYERNRPCNASRIDAFRASGIGAVDAWSVAHPSLPVDEYPGAARWRRGMVLLPVHQELRAIDVERIASVARHVLSRRD